MSESKMDQAGIWEKALPKLWQLESEPEDEIVNFLKERYKTLGRKGLDIGCGMGRHTLVGLQLGHDMSAVDFSAAAIEKTHNLVAEFGFECSARLALMEHLPFPDGRFDFTFSWCVLNHGTRETFERSVLESIRVLRRGGLSIGLVMSRADPRYGTGTGIAKDCFTFDEGVEAGICHYFPSKSHLLGLLQRMGVVESFKHIRHTGEALRRYHPGLSYSAHFLYTARRD